MATDTRVGQRPHPPRARPLGLFGILALLLLVAGALALSLAGGDDGVVASRSAAARTAAAPTAYVSVAIDARRPGHPVPSRFLGLSFEVGALAQIAGYGTQGDTASLLRSLGPGLLRFGGISADTRTAWADSLDPKPAWASNTIGPADLRRLRVLAQSSGWRVLLTVGLAHYNPSSAAREVAAAKAILGPWLAGIEIGNESDAYARHGFRARGWGPARYNAQVSAYRRAIARLAPGIPLAGPDVSGSRSYQRWGPAEVRMQRPAMLTGHHYPLGCHRAQAASVEQLLSPGVRLQENVSLSRYMRVAERAHIPLRLDEANTVSCGGVAGVSDTFAAALWATSYLTRAMSAGAAGINLEGNPARCNGYSVLCAPTPARLAAGDLQAQPEWYALLLTRGLIGDRPVTTRITAPRGLNMTVTALLAPNGSMHAVIVDEAPLGSPMSSVQLRVGNRFHAAAVVRMSAGSPTATSGASLGSSSVAADGSWAGAARRSTLAVEAGTVTVAMAPSSAALVTIRR